VSNYIHFDLKKIQGYVLQKENGEFRLSFLAFPIVSGMNNAFGSQAEIFLINNNAPAGIPGGALLVLR
jgi:hypothetical protein